MSAISGAAAALPRRIAAFAVDYVFIAAYLLVVVGAGALLRLVATGLAANLFADPLRAELIGFLTLTVPVSLYFVIGEASPAGATWGKRRMGLRVVTSRGARLTLGRSVLRTSLKFVPWELTHALIWRFALAEQDPRQILTLGLIVVWLLIDANFASVLIDRERRSLYDLLARTRVVRVS